jgi:hypothetical protein
MIIDDFAYVKLTTYGKMLNQETHESLEHLPKIGKWCCPKMMDMKPFFSWFLYWKIKGFDTCINSIKEQLISHINE